MKVVSEAALLEAPNAHTHAQEMGPINSKKKWLEFFAMATLTHEPAHVQQVLLAQEAHIRTQKGKE